MNVRSERVQLTRMTAVDRRYQRTGLSAKRNTETNRVPLLTILQISQTQQTIVKVILLKKLQ